MTPEFRRDIEIARGGAILGVFFYHLLPVSLPAGFLGVDIFFVLSGYLMSAVYRPGAPGALREYLLRRGRRILPAYFTTIVAVLLVSLVVTLPHEFADVVRHAEFSAFLIPNIGVWLDGSYFDKAAFRPALHLWSLGVELQFYIVAPLIAYLVRRRPLALAALALASLAACLVVVEIRPRYAFFLTPFRL